MYNYGIINGVASMWKWSIYDENANIKLFHKLFEFVCRFHIPIYFEKYTGIRVMFHSWFVFI